MLNFDMEFLAPIFFGILLYKSWQSRKKFSKEHDLYDKGKRANPPKIFNNKSDESFVKVVIILGLILTFPFSILFLIMYYLFSPSDYKEFQRNYLGSIFKKK